MAERLYEAPVGRVHARLEALFSVLTASRSTTAEARTTADVFAGICRVAVDVGGYRFAWVAWHRDGRLEPVARYGADEGYIDAVSAVLDEHDERGTGPTSRCLRSGAAVLVRDFSADPTVRVWREAAARAAVNAAASFPIRRNGVVVGAFSVYASSADDFGPQALEVLQRVAVDASHAAAARIGDLDLHDVEARAERWRAQLVRYLETSPTVSYALEERDGVWVPTWVSPNITRILGFEELEALSVDWWIENLHPDDRDRVLSAWHALRGDDPFQMEYRFLRRDGTVLWILDAMRVVWDEAGRRHAIGAWTDVTKAKSAESALSESESRFRLALAAAEQGIWDLDVASGAVIVSPEYATMLGEDPAALVMTRETWQERLHPDDREQTARALQAYLDGRVADYRREFRMRHRHGHWVWVLSNGQVVDRRADGTPRRMLGTHIDVSRIKQVESDLAVRSKALEVAANAMVITDADGGIQWCNPAFAALIDQGPAELLGRRIDLVLGMPDDPAAAASVWASLRAGRVVESENVCRRSSGAAFPAAIVITPVPDDDGVVRHYVALLRDLTEVQAQQQRLLQAQKLESVGRLAGGVAHDFNNVLTVVNSCLDLALERMDARDPLFEELSDARAAGTRATALTRQLLAFSRQQIVRPRPFDVNAVVADLARMLQRLLGARLTLEVALAADALHITADPGQLEQVIVNLAVNARDAMPHGGTLRIESACVDLPELRVRSGTVAAGRYVRLRVGDTGAGIPDELLDRIFEPFFTTKEAGRGTGLGLATVYGIVQHAGGFIDVASTVESGTTFDLLFPLVDPTSTAKVWRSGPHATVAPAGRNRTGVVLLVDDEPSVRSVAQRILTRAGHRVVACASGLEALAWLESHQDAVDVLLTDVVMPGMSGLELVAAVRAREPSIRVLFSSGYPDGGALMGNILPPDVDFVGKPYSVKELSAKVEEVLGHAGSG